MAKALLHNGVSLWRRRRGRGRVLRKSWGTEGLELTQKNRSRKTQKARHGSPSSQLPLPESDPALLPLALCVTPFSFPRSFHGSQGFRCDPPRPNQPRLAHLRNCHSQGQKVSAPPQPPPDPKAQAVGRSPQGNQALLPSMEKRGRETAVTSKRRKEAGRGGPGMWGREAGEAAVWEAASPRGRRPAHQGTSCSLGCQPRTCTQPWRLPRPNDSGPVQKPRIPGETVRRKGSSRLALLSGFAFALPLSWVLTAPGIGSPPHPLTKLYTAAGQVPKNQGG